MQSLTGWISGISHNFIRVLVVVALATTLMAIYQGGNPSFLSQESLNTILEAQQPDKECFHWVFKPHSAVERAYTQEGMFRRSVIEYKHKINLPVPDASWTLEARIVALTCGMKFGVNLAAEGLGHGDIQTTTVYVLLAQDRESPELWWVLEATKI